MMIEIGQNDFGVQIPIRLYPVDGRAFTHDELISANFNCYIFRIDSLSVPMEIVDDKFYPVDKQYFHWYKQNQSVKINDELMIVFAISLANLFVQVTRDIKVQVHQKGSIVKHIVAESVSAVEYNSTNRTIYFTPLSIFQLYPGRYQMQIDLITPDRKATCLYDDQKAKTLLSVKSSISQGD